MGTNPFSLTDPEAARLRLTKPMKTARGYCNVAAKQVTNGGETVYKSDVKVRSVRDLKYAEGELTWVIHPWRRDFVGTRHESAIDALHRLAELRAAGLVIPHQVMKELAVEALYDAGFDGMPW